MSTSQPTSPAPQVPSPNNPPNPLDAPKPPKKSFGLIVFALIVVVLVIVVVAVSLSHKTTTKTTSNTYSVSSNVEVSITKTAFVPAAITVITGQVVVWTNNDTSPHQVASDPYPTDNALLSLNSQTPLSQGQSYSYVFNKTGTYTYHDNLNPYTLKGTVIVK